MIPDKHKGILLKEFGGPLVMEDVATPKPKGDAVLIKTISAGICHSDVSAWKGQTGTMATMPLPIVLGHEIVGTIVARGERVPDDVKEGDTVLVYVGGQYAKEDKYTRKGLEQLARTARPFMGGLQEYLLVPNHRFLVNVDDLDDVHAAAPLSCAALTSYGAVKKIRPYVEPDEYLAIVGLGGLGSYAAQWVNLFLPFANLVGIDVKEEALNFASRLSKMDTLVNASKEDPLETIKDVTKGEGVKAIIDFVGITKTVSTYLNVLSPRGIYVAVGLMGGAREIMFQLPQLLAVEATMQGNVMGSLQDQYEIVQFARKKRLNYSAVVTRRCKFETDQVNEAFNDLEEGKVQGRQIVALS